MRACSFKTRFCSPKQCSFDANCFDWICCWPEFQHCLVGKDGGQLRQPNVIVCDHNYMQLPQNKGRHSHVEHSDDCVLPRWTVFLKSLLRFIWDDEFKLFQFLFANTQSSFTQELVHYNYRFGWWKPDIPCWEKRRRLIKSPTLSLATKRLKEKALTQYQ